MISVRSFFRMGQISRAMLGSLMLIVLLLTGCYKDRTRQPSILILAVENYGPDTALCSWESNPQVQSALDPFCREATEVKLAQSVHRDSVPALAALLFGSSPQELKVETNEQSVPAAFESYAEKFHQHDQQTAFFASSPLFMRRTGLAQGFDLFDETHKVEARRWGRRHEEVLANFFRWKADLGSTSSYAVLTFSDLNFPWTKTTSLSGQERSRNLESQIEGLEEAWVTLFQRLKSMPDWNNTWVFIGGLQGQAQSLNPNQIYAAIRPPQGQQLGLDVTQPLTLAELSRRFHMRVMQNQIVTPTATTASLIENVGPLTSRPREEFWIRAAGSDQRERFFAQLSEKDPHAVWWELYEMLKQKKAKSFTQVVERKKIPFDSEAYWERLTSDRKNKTLQDPCIRMIDLKIFEGGGAKTCDSAVLIAMQDWLRTIEESAPEARQKEARQKTLRAWNELESIRLIHLLNRAQGTVLDLPLEVGREILRTEMALSLPAVQMQKAWLDKAEPSLNITYE